jgi:hypothetical protein
MCSKRPQKGRQIGDKYPPESGGSVIKDFTDPEHWSLDPDPDPGV